MPKFNSIDNIPAKLFFEILRTKDFKLLQPKWREKNLDKVFMSIYDDYFIRSENEQAKEFLRLQNELLANEYKVNILKQSLAFYFYNKTTEQMRKDFIEALKKGFRIVIDESVPFIEEVQRVLNIEIGILENEISMSKIGLKEFKKGGEDKDFDYYDSLVGLSNVLTGNTMINDSITLAVYVSLEKSAKKQIENANKKK